MKTRHIVGIGEVLWDIFPDGPRFGGAPSNFSCSAAELARDAAQVFVVSAVGTDELGDRALESLAEHHVLSSGVQRNPQETGKVLVELNSAGVARYRFAEHSAWDSLDWTEDLRQIAETCDAVCFGTLGQRNQCSRETIQRFVRSTPQHAFRILDVNLRAPYIDETVITESLDMATVLKLNDEELPRLAKLFAITGNDQEIMQQLANQFDLRLVALTRGAQGALIISGNEISLLPGVQVDIADTVGAGDAYTAAMTLGMLHGHSVQDINRAAIEAAAYVCSKPGATMVFPEDIRGNVLNSD